MNALCFPAHAPQLAAPTFRLIEPHLDERLRRLVAAAEVAAAGPGGVSAMSRATGVSRRAIRAGAKEVKARGAAALAPGGFAAPVGGASARSIRTRRWWRTWRR